MRLTRAVGFFLCVCVWVCRQSQFSLRHVVSQQLLTCQFTEEKTGGAASGDAADGGTLSLGGLRARAEEAAHAALHGAHQRQNVPSFKGKLRDKTLVIEWGQLFVPQLFGRPEHLHVVVTDAIREACGPITLDMPSRQLASKTSESWPDSDKFVMVAYRRGPVAYVREWRQREVIQIPYKSTDSDEGGPFVVAPRLHIHKAWYGSRFSDKYRKNVTHTLRTIVGPAAMLRVLLVHMGDLPDFGPLPALGTLCADGWERVRGRRCGQS